jgi:toxin ParE1/3/4
MADYRLTPAAERDLEGIWAYTCERWSVAQAERYTDELTGAFAELAEWAARRAVTGMRPLNLT